MPGKFFLAANSAIAASLSNSCQPNSRLGNPNITSLLPYFLSSFSNWAYSRLVAPHFDATLVAYTTLPRNSSIFWVEPSPLVAASE
eukprot:CAMPEP_0116096292 /NCGR_PEP_ID=MMETSP0327-20121206/10107_1 /TAXON_ID=44447 /ORGANISM="Pseudo-nitzschia delicatissima, Strain B596" /LENGTH=85 /DNA_ID=CAMNT_0003587993 /DNA_START=506 /DNA_END=763 /DNA_ORIENTATION=+